MSSRVNLGISTKSNCELKLGNLGVMSPHPNSFRREADEPERSRACTAAELRQVKQCVE